MLSRLTLGFALGAAIFGFSSWAVGCGPCLQSVGACGRNQVFYDTCKHRVVIVEPTPPPLQVPPRLSIGFRPGVEAPGWTASSADGAQLDMCVVDGPKLTKVWRCKKRDGEAHCHIYRQGAEAFAAYVKGEYISPFKQAWSRKWCTAQAGCAPMLTAL